MMSLWDALRMNMMISYQELVRTFLRQKQGRSIPFATIHPEAKYPVTEIFFLKRKRVILWEEEAASLFYRSTI
ncbi:hypothetical protein, partial [Klebsiella pneumoniae]|uniref:hypothetical protein n=1 Tax=Klebsiella pneumoniae TaxID=573 RepID=UPI0029352D9D